MKDNPAKLVKAGHLSHEKKNTGTNSDNASTATAPPTKAAAKKGTKFAVVEEESEDKELPTFKDYLRREGMIFINVQNDTSGFTGDTIVEYGVGYVEIDDVSTPPPTSDDADKWKVQGRGGPKPDNRKQVVKTVPSKKLVSFYQGSM